MPSLRISKKNDSRRISECIVPDSITAKPNLDCLLHCTCAM